MRTTDPLLQYEILSLMPFSAARFEPFHSLFCVLASRCPFITHLTSEQHDDPRFLDACSSGLVLKCLYTHASSYRHAFVLLVRTTSWLDASSCSAHPRCLRHRACRSGVRVHDQHISRLSVLSQYTGQCVWQASSDHVPLWLGSKRRACRCQEAGEPALEVPPLAVNERVVD